MGFKAGDVVVLKSGSPKMTVTETYSNGGVVKTIWFIDGKVNWGEFVSETLEITT